MLTAPRASISLCDAAGTCSSTSTITSPTGWTASASELGRGDRAPQSGGTSTNTILGLKIAYAVGKPSSPVASAEPYAISGREGISACLPCFPITRALSVDVPPRLMVLARILAGVSVLI